MKIEKLTDNKIRIIMNIDDLAKKNIDIHSLIKDTEMSQKLFKKILKQAQKQVDFETEDSKLLIEAYISTEGFFILTFTKIAEDLKIDKYYGARPKAKRKDFNPSCNVAIYQFDSFDDFENFCTYLKNSKLGNLKGFAKRISLYEYDAAYFLAFSDINKEFKNASLLYTSLSEFAKLSSNSSCFESKLVEYGKTILKSKNDMSKLLNYFNV